MRRRMLRSEMIVKRMLRVIAIGMAAVCCLIGTSAAACDPHEELLNRIDAALSKAVDFLVQKQHEDGTWRSATYGALREDLALTPTIAKALMLTPGGAESHDACMRALDALRSWINTPQDSNKMR